MTPTETNEAGPVSRKQLLVQIEHNKNNAEFWEMTSGSWRTMFYRNREISERQSKLAEETQIVIDRQKANIREHMEEKAELIDQVGGHQCATTIAAIVLVVTTGVTYGSVGLPGGSLLWVSAPTVVAYLLARFMWWVA